MTKSKLFFVFAIAALLIAAACSGSFQDPGALESISGGTSGLTGGGVTGPGTPAAGGGGLFGGGGGDWGDDGGSPWGGGGSGGGGGGSGGGSGGGGGGSVSSLSGTRWKCVEDYYGVMEVTYILRFTSSSRVTLEYSMMNVNIDTYEGTYTLSGSRITVEWDEGYRGTATYSVSGKTMTSSEGNKFTKQ